MVALPELWLPILLSAVLVFIASSLLHMVLPLHRGDYAKLPGEAGLLEAMRREGVVPGQYMFPCAGSLKEAGTPEMIEKFRAGPVGLVTVMPSGPPAIGRNLAQWFVFSIVVGVFVGYAAAVGLERGAEYMDVFRLTGTVAILGYAISHVPDSIWKGLSWRITAKFVFDGVVYGLLTAGTFAWLWPAAAAG